MPGLMRRALLSLVVAASAAAVLVPAPAQASQRLCAYVGDGRDTASFPGVLHLTARGVDCTVARRVADAVKASVEDQRHLPRKPEVEGAGRWACSYGKVKGGGEDAQNGVMAYCSPLKKPGRRRVSMRLNA